MELTDQEVVEIFVNTKMEEEYNFLQADLVALAQAFIEAARGKIAETERIECVKVARSVNHLVAEKIMEVRGNAQSL